LLIQPFTIQSFYRCHLLELSILHNPEFLQVPLAGTQHSAHRVCVFRIDLTINSDCFPKQH
jgi:hypothetical protein